MKIITNPEVMFVKTKRLTRIPVIPSLESPPRFYMIRNFTNIFPLPYQSFSVWYLRAALASSHSIVVLLRLKIPYYGKTNFLSACAHTFGSLMGLHNTQTEINPFLLWTASFRKHDSTSHSDLAAVLTFEQDSNSNRTTIIPLPYLWKKVNHWETSCWIYIELLIHNIWSTV